MNDRPACSTPRVGSRFAVALAYAGEVHTNQRRKGGEIPYVSHLLAVCSLVLEDGGDEDEAIAAVLHDAAEDQGGQRRLDEIAELFGDRVAAIVEGCSDTLETPKPPWRERKERYLAHLETATPDVLRVALADKVHNARSTVADLKRRGDDLWESFNAGPGEQLWYYRSLVDVFRRRGASRPMVEELAALVKELERLVARAATPGRRARRTA